MGQKWTRSRTRCTCVGSFPQIICIGTRRAQVWLAWHFSSAGRDTKWGCCDCTDNFCACSGQSHVYFGWLTPGKTRLSWRAAIALSAAALVWKVRNAQPASWLVILCFIINKLNTSPNSVNIGISSSLLIVRGIWKSVVHNAIHGSVSCSFGNFESCDTRTVLYAA